MNHHEEDEHLNMRREGLEQTETMSTSRKVFETKGSGCLTSTEMKTPGEFVCGSVKTDCTGLYECRLYLSSG